jgi:hypothetical protein
MTEGLGDIWNRALFIRRRDCNREIWIDGRRGWVRRQIQYFGGEARNEECNDFLD